MINSGFGFSGCRPRIARGRVPGVAYLGTVDFVKMHPGFFDAIDAWATTACASPYGGRSIRRAPWSRAPRPCAIRTGLNSWGERRIPQAALADADIFFYPLQRDHYGTAENALVEAMSLGLAPLVLDNPAEKAIVHDGKTGFVASSIEEIGSLLEMLLLLPDVREKISRNAIHCHCGDSNTRDVRAGFHDPLARHACRTGARLRFRERDRFNAGRMVPVDATSAGTAWAPEVSDAAARPAKGTLAHFESAFAGDDSFARLKKARA